MTVLTGGRTIWAFVWEDSNEYAQEPGEPSDTNFKAFGNREDVNEPDRDNNYEALFRPFNRQPDTYLELEFTGSWGTDFVYTNPWWLAFIFGEPEVEDNEDGTWDLEFSVRTDEVPRSAHLIRETHYPDGTTTQTVFMGAVVDGPSLNTSVQDTMDVSLDGFYADERHYDDVADSPVGEIGDQPETEFRPLNFANAELYLDLDDDGSPEFTGNVQDLDLTFNSNAEADHELGTRFSTERTFLGFEPDLSYTSRITTQSKAEEQKSFYGSQVDDTLDHEMPAEELTDAAIMGRVQLLSRKEENELTVNFEEAFPSTYSPTNLGDPESAMDNSVDRLLTNLTATATVDKDPAEYF